MKLTAIFLLIGCLQVSAAIYSQGISISQRNTKSEEIFNKIPMRTGYNFIYASDIIQKTRNIDLYVKNETIENGLIACLNDQPSTDFIIAEQKRSPLLLIEIKGKVVNEMGQGMAGVSVVLKGTSIGTMTDDQGIFSINASKGNVLVFSYVGYDSKEVVVDNEAMVNVQLSPDTQQLDQVVITALGITKQKRALGYSTTEVDGSKLTQ